MNKNLFAAGAAMLLTGASLLTTLTAAQADVTYGGDARAFAMGGAGVAVFYDPTAGTARYNPASLAFEKKGFNLYVPSVGIRANGLNLDRAYSYLLKGADQGDATDLARDYASEDSGFALNANAGFRIGSIEVLAGGVGKGKLQPNDALKQWADVSDGNLGAIPSNAQADIYAAGYYTLPSVAFGAKLPVKKGMGKGDLAIGVRARFLRGLYTHYIADASDLQNDGDAEKAPELEGEDFLDKTGLGVDLGFMYVAKGGLQVGIVGQNLIKPNLKFKGTNRDGVTEDFDLIKTTVTAGLGYQKKGLTLAADITDLTGSIGDTQLRAGAEQKFGKWFAVRGGYASSNGFTVGVGIGGFDIAYSDNAALEVTRSINF